MGGQLGVPEEKFAALADYASSDLFDERERTALEYADCMTITHLEVCDELFDQLGQWFTHDALVELTATIAWENASSKFNRALRVPSQELVQSVRSRGNRNERGQQPATDSDDQVGIAESPDTPSSC